MVLRNPPLAEPVKYPGGVKSKPPFEMGVANLDRFKKREHVGIDQPNKTEIYNEIDQVDNNGKTQII